MWSSTFKLDLTFIQCPKQVQESSFWPHLLTVAITFCKWRIIFLRGQFEVSFVFQIFEICWLLLIRNVYKRVISSWSLFLEFSHLWREQLAFWFLVDIASVDVLWKTKRKIDNKPVWTCGKDSSILVGFFYQYQH